MKKILVTGAAGFVGYHVAEILSKSEDTIVVGIDNINDYYDVSLKYARLSNIGIKEDQITWYDRVQSDKYSNFSFVRMNLEDKKELVQLCEAEHFNFIVHLAAQAGVRYSIENPDVYAQSNLIGFLNILEVSRNFKIEHLVYASSSSVYGMNKKMPFSVSDNVDHPISLYAATKKANELMAYTYSHLYSIPTTGLRFFTVYGPWGRPDMAYYLFAEAILSGKPIKVFNQGKMKRDFTYIDDIVNGVINVLLSPPAKKDNTLDGTVTPAYRLYNIGNNNPVQLMDFISVLKDALGKEPVMEYLEMQPGDVPATWADVDELINNFDYRPNTDIKVGLKKFVDWYKSYYSISN